MQSDTGKKLESLNIHKQEYYSCFYKIHVDNNTASPSPLNALDWVRIVFDLKSETTYKGIAKWKLCADQIKVPYYVDNDNSERKDLCFPWGATNAANFALLKKSFKTVLPMCDSCKEMRKKPFTQRSYGKPKKVNWILLFGQFCFWFVFF